MSLQSAQEAWEAAPYQVDTPFWTRTTALLRRGSEAFDELGNIVATGADISRNVRDARLAQWDVTDTIARDRQDLELTELRTERGDNQLWPIAIIGAVALVLILT